MAAGPPRSEASEGTTCHAWISRPARTRTSLSKPQSGLLCYRRPRKLIHVLPLQGSRGDFFYSEQVTATLKTTQWLPSTQSRGQNLPDGCASCPASSCSPRLTSPHGDHPSHHVGHFPIPPSLPNTEPTQTHTHTRHMPPLGQNVLWLRATALNRHPTEARTVSPGTWSCPYAQVSRLVSKGIRDGVESLMAQLQPDLASAPGVGDTQTARGCSCEAPMQLPPWFLCPSSPGDLYRLVAPHSESQINQHGPTEVCMAPDPSQVQTTC